jgi:hypothetical protein
MLDGREVVNMSDTRRLIDAAGAAAARIREMGRADASLLSTIVTAVRAETTRNRFRAAAILAELTRDYPEAREAVMRMTTADEWHLRRRAMQCIGRESPRPFAAEILRKGLFDDDRGVRDKAVSAAYGLHLTELVEDLARYHTTFPSERPWDVEFSLPMLRDGYILKDLGGDELVLQTFNSRCAMSRKVTRGELANRGIAAIVAEMRGIDADGLPQ